MGDENENKRGQLLQFLQIYISKLILEVFGSAGAIWGFSEVIGLRVSSTVWFWRPCAFCVGVIFFGRWVCEIRENFVKEQGGLTLWMKRMTLRRIVDNVAKEEEVRLSEMENRVCYM
mmetsp:Transcript_2113/g.4040  ORF Transcript_2113/g.4040 Transcript_2113/m.4040 type:complete len:117 (+) Transcript_2113:774-1124(+)